VAAGQDLASFAVLMPRTIESGEFDRKGRRLPVIEYPLLFGGYAVRNAYSAIRESQIRF
jgi:hypothetical protein